jgi:hypothetical protein
MWVPIVLAAMATALATIPVSRFVGSESVVAFGMALVAVLLLFELERLA